MAAAKEPPAIRAFALEGGAFGFLVKPFDLIDLAGTGRFHPLGGQDVGRFRQEATFHTVSNYFRFSSS